MKKLRVTIELDVDDLPPETRREIEQSVSDEGEAELPTLAQTSAGEAAGLLESINEHTSTELFGGTDVYVRFMECRVLEANWK